MATTDLTEWRLRDTDLTTQLAIIPAGQSHLYLEINEPGSGELRLPLDTTTAGQISSGMFAECYYRGSSRGGFFIENIKESQADAGEYGGRWLSISGRGALALLEDAIVWDNGTTETTREFTGVTKASILITLITEAQARGGLANLTYDFTATDDSASVAWTDSEYYKLNVGTSLLDVARQFAKTGGFDFEINLSGADFLLSAYSAGSGSDLSETIYMRTGTNCEEVSSDERGDVINNALRVKYKGAYLTVSDSTSITNRRRREKLLSLEQAQTAASATTYAAAKIAQTKDPKKSIALRVYDGVSPRLFVDYDMGDYIMLDVLGTETRYRILGIQADFDGADFSNVVLELNTILYDNEMEMSQDLDWLLAQWNTAKDANLLEVSFWAAISLNGAVNALHEYNGKIYIGGSFTAAPLQPVDAAFIVAYNPATRLFETLPAYPGQAVNCITHIGSTIYVAGTEADIWQYAGGAWSAVGTILTASPTVRALETDGTDLYIGGSNIGDVDSVPINCNVAKLTVGTGVWSSVGAANDTTFCYALKWFGGDLYGGFSWDLVESSSFQKFSGGSWSVEQSATVDVQALGATATQLVIVEGGSTNKTYLWDGVAVSWTQIATLSGFASGFTVATNLEDVYLGGKFTALSGNTDIDDLAKYSGGEWIAQGSGVTGSNNRVLAILYDTQGDLYIGGSFTTLNGISCSNFGVYMTDFENMQKFNGIEGSAGVDWGQIGGTLSNQVDLQAELDAKVSLLSANYVDLTDGGLTTLHKHQDLNTVVAPAVNILTLTNAAAATLALNITAAKTLTLTATDNYTLTIPATGTAALLATANVFTKTQTINTDAGNSLNLGANFETPAYVNTGGTGDRTASITVTHNYGTLSGTINHIVDGAFVEDVYLYDADLTGKYIRFQFGASVIINEITYTRSAGGTWDDCWGVSVLKIQGSNDGTNWTDLKADFTPDTTVPQVWAFTNTVAYTYYRLVGVSGSPTYYEAPKEFEFKIGNGLPIVIQSYIGATPAGILSLIPSGGTLRVSGYDVTVPASLTIAGRNLANTFTRGQFIDGSADDIQLRVQGHSSQSANLQTWENSSAGVLGSINSVGALYFVPTATNPSIAGYGMTLAFEKNASGADAQSNYGLFVSALTKGVQNYSGTIRGIFGSAGHDGSGTVGVVEGLNYTIAIANTGNVGAGIVARLSVDKPGVGNFTDLYGLYIGNINVGTSSNYAILTNAGLVQHGDAVSITGIRDTSQLYVLGHTTQTLPVGYLIDNTAATNTVRNVLRLEAQSTGTAAAGLGAGLLFSVETATASTMQTAAQIAASWIDATNATRKAKLSLSAYDTAIRTGLEIEANGTTPDIRILGDTWWEGEGFGLPYGSCYGNEIAWAQASAVQNTWYEISDADMADGQLNLVTHDGSGKLTVVKAGRYLINWSVSAECSAPNKHIQGTISVSGTETNDGLDHAINSTANEQFHLSSTAILDLAASATIEISLRTTDTGTPDLAVDHLNITLVQIGGT